MTAMKIPLFAGPVCPVNGAHFKFNRFQKQLLYKKFQPEFYNCRVAMQLSYRLVNKG
jgi:hypothetical protein